MNNCQELLAWMAAQAGPSGLLTYAQYVEHCLYAPELGYYSKFKKRVGKGAQTDFYTAKTLGTVFERLVLQAAYSELGQELRNDAVFVEIGAEPDQPPWGGPSSPFKKHCTALMGDPLPWNVQGAQEGPYVVFANELLDAQPFERVCFLEGKWHLLGVKVDLQGAQPLKEVVLSEASAEMIACLPQASIPGYTVDLPTGARLLLTDLLKGDWYGSLILFDYGKSWAQLVQETPQGTARTYFRHRQGSDLLKYPGNEDITHHIVWDWVEEDLRANGFNSPKLERQEAYFMKNANGAVREILESGTLEDRSALKALLHPGHLGSKFQAMTANRE